MPSLARQTGETPQPVLNTGDMPRPVLSQTGQLISQLLTGRFGEPEPVPLARGASLLPAAPAKAAELAPLLKQAISNSGLFLRVSPASVGGRQVATERTAARASGTANATPPIRQPPVRTAASSKPLHSPCLQRQGKASRAGSEAAIPATQANLAATDEAAESLPARPAQLEAFAEQAGKSSTPRNVAELLMPVVQQQLEALATHQMSWQGQVCRACRCRDIIDPEPQSKPGAGDEEAMRFWRSALRLQLPHLGDIQAQLVLGPQGLSVLIDTNSCDAFAQRMRAAQTELLNALEAAGVSVINRQVSEHASLELRTEPTSTAPPPWRWPIRMVMQPRASWPRAMA